MMSDDMLSQEEIEALLKGTASNNSSSESHSIDAMLTPMEKDAIGEIGNISFGTSATTLSTLLNQKVEITTPLVELIESAKLVEEFPRPYVAVGVRYVTGIEGANILVINTRDAAVIADLMLGGTGEVVSPELNEIQLSAVQEAMNQMMGSSATSMSTIFKKKVDISPPSIDILNLPEGEGAKILPDEKEFVKVSFKLRVGKLIDSNIMQLISPKFARILVEQLFNQEPVEEVVPERELAMNTEEPVKVSQPQEPQAQYVAPSQQYSRNEETRYMSSKQPKKETYNPADVHPASFTQFQPTGLGEHEARNLDMLLDIPLTVSVELGKTMRTVKDILELGNGSIIELDKLAGEPIDIKVNNKLIAKGEVVVIEENFGVRITDIVSQSDRLRNLR